MLFLHKAYLWFCVTSFQPFFNYVVSQMFGICTLILFQLLQIKCQQMQQMLETKMSRIEELTNSLSEKDTALSQKDVIIASLNAKIEKLSK